MKNALVFALFVTSLYGQDAPELALSKDYRRAAMATLSAMDACSANVKFRANPENKFVKDDYKYAEEKHCVDMFDKLKLAEVEVSTPADKFIQSKFHEYEKMIVGEKNSNRYDVCGPVIEEALSNGSIQVFQKISSSSLQLVCK